MIVLIYLYVDDLIVIGNSDELVEVIKVQISQVFEMKDLGKLHYCLGLEVSRDLGQAFVAQGNYVRELLKKFKMDQCKVVAVLIQQNVKFQSDDGSKEVDDRLYKQLVGSSIYLTASSPNLAYSINVLVSL